MNELFENAESRDSKRELSTAEKEQVLVDAEINLTALRGDIANLEVRANLTQEENELLAILREQAEGLEDFIRVGREPESRGTVKQIL